MPRLFTGIELPDDVVWRLSMIRAGLSGAHWIDPDNYHITMRFAGDITDEDLRHLRRYYFLRMSRPFRVL